MSLMYTLWRTVTATMTAHDIRRMHGGLHLSARIKSSVNSPLWWQRHTLELYRRASIKKLPGPGNPLPLRPSERYAHNEDNTFLTRERHHSRETSWSVGKEMLFSASLWHAVTTEQNKKTHCQKFKINICISASVSLVLNFVFPRQSVP